MSSTEQLVLPAAPPPYPAAEPGSLTEDRTARDLRESFAVLLDEQTNVQRLFVRVSSRLEHTKHIGRGHPLWVEWDEMRERHQKLHRYSQQSAGQCASFLQTFSTVLVPLSTSSMNFEEKKAMISKFTESIPVHQEKARQTSRLFSALVHDVETFPSRVAAYVAHAESEAAAGFWQQLWRGLRSVCAVFWRALLGIFEELVDAFRGMFDRIARVQCSFAGFFVTVDMFGPPDRAGASQLTGAGAPPGSAQAGLERDCERLAHGLRMFEDAWHLVGLATSMLLDKVTLAGQLTAIPLACDATLRTVERVYAPLLECLRAYAVGKALKY